MKLLANENFPLTAVEALRRAGHDEKRWGDGVLARKKGLGF